MTIATTGKFAPVESPTHYPPLKVNEDTYLIRDIYGEGTEPGAVYINSLVILAKEPVIVDTGTVANRRRWLEDVFGLVEPKDVRWIFISHDDHDHTGNLEPVLEMCPDAKLVTNWWQVERLIGDYSLPMGRMRWVNDGDSFDAGDRRLAAIRPPVFDSPTTRGLYDAKRGLYWAGDSFATLIPGPIENVAEMDHDFYSQWFAALHSMISPWHTMLDATKFGRSVDRIAELDLRTVVGGHSPVTSGNQIQEALAMLRNLPFQEAAPLPGQADLDAIIASMTGVAA